MQGEFREKRSFKGHGRLGKIPFACLCPLILVSCSLFQITPPGNSPHDILATVCLEGQGKGRIGMGRNRYVFSYESSFKEKNLFAMILNIPIHGEESLFVDIKKGEISGSIQQWKDNERLRPFLELLPQFLLYLQGLGNHMARDCKEGSEQVFKCHFMEIKRNDREVQVIFPKKGNPPPRITLSALNVFYRKITWTDLGLDPHPILELFPSECRQNQTGLP